MKMKPIDKEKIRAMKEFLRKGLDQKCTEKRFIPMPPRYDNVFYEGLAWLDSLEWKKNETTREDRLRFHKSG